MLTCSKNILFDLLSRNFNPDVPRHCFSIVSSVPLICPCFSFVSRVKLSKSFNYTPYIFSQKRLHIVKKVRDIPVPSRDVTNQTFPGREYLMTSRLETGNSLTIFYSVPRDHCGLWAQYIPSFLYMFLPGNCSTLTLLFHVSDPVFVIMEYVAKGKLQELLRKSRAEQYYGNLHGTIKSIFLSFCFS
jgi:hypothetical protein